MLLLISLLFDPDTQCVYTHAAGAVDLILRMFPPFPIPGFAPNFTGYDDDWEQIDWYEAD